MERKELTIQYRVKIEVSKCWGIEYLWCRVFIHGTGAGEAMFGHGGMSETSQPFPLMVSLLVDCFATMKTE